MVVRASFFFKEWVRTLADRNNESNVFVQESPLREFRVALHRDISFRFL